MDKEQLEAAFKNSQSKACKFFATNEFVLHHAEIIKPVKGKRGDGSKNSFQFQVKPTSEAIAKLFNITSTKDFEARFEEAISGDGQEAQRITRLGSSSLLAFLCFNAVSKERPLKISWGENICCRFNEVHFECRNQITTGENSRCSNIDVLLIGNYDDTGKPVALFLESKFSEHFGRSSSFKNISIIYKEDYDDFFRRSWDSLEYQPGKDESGNDTIELRTKGDTQYCAGIKQMISHYRGLRILARNHNSHSESNQSNVFHFDGLTDVFLGSIVFDFSTNISDKKDALGAYRKLYKDFVNHCPENQPFRIVPELLTYQQVFACQKSEKQFLLPQKVRAMYFPQTLKTRQ